jgi:hypothetical protein
MAPSVAPWQLRSSELGAVRWSTLFTLSLIKTQETTAVCS